MHAAGRWCSSIKTWRWEPMLGMYWDTGCSAGSAAHHQEIHRSHDGAFVDGLWQGEMKGE